MHDRAPLPLILPPRRRERGSLGAVCWTAAALVAVLVVMASGASGASAAAERPEAEEARARQLVDAYNARPFGNPGWRRVRLALRTRDEITRDFVVENAWSQSGNVVRTVFVLDRPQNLRGTDYLLVEDPAEAAGMKVFLHLPAGSGRVLTILPSRFGEGLLGSDFGYRDLRMRIPTTGYAFHLAGRQELAGVSAWRVDAVPVTPAARQSAQWGRSRYYLSALDPVLLGADFFVAAGDTRPAKQLRIPAYRRIGGAWTETQMVMSAADGHSSTLTLVDFNAAPRLDPRLFEPDGLPAAAQLLAALAPPRPGAPPAKVQR
jgi:hypothetical protein